MYEYCEIKIIPMHDLEAKRQADGDGWSTYRMLPFRYFFMRRSIGPGRFRN